LLKDLCWMTYAKPRWRLRSLSFIATFVVVLLLCGACVSEKQEVDSLAEDLLNDRPCPIPCWQGIVPGQTTEQEAVDILSAKDRPTYIGRPGISHLKGKEETIIKWKNKGAEMPRQVSSASAMWIRKGTVHHTLLTLDPGLTAQMVVDKWGEPNKIFVYVHGAEYLHEWASLCYPELGVEFTVFLGFGRTPLTLSPDDPVLLSDLYVPMTVEQWLSESLDQDPWRYRPQDPNKILDWPGFGSIPREAVESI
jgi:hypothetical protein